MIRSIYIHWNWWMNGFEIRATWTTSKSDLKKVPRVKNSISDSEPWSLKRGMHKIAKWWERPSNLWQNYHFWFTLFCHFTIIPNFMSFLAHTRHPDNDGDGKFHIRVYLESFYVEKVQEKKDFLFLDGRLIGAQKLEDKKGLNYIPLIPLIFVGFLHSSIIINSHHRDVQQIFFYKQSSSAKKYVSMEWNLRIVSRTVWDVHTSLRNLLMPRSNFIRTSLLKYFYHLPPQQLVLVYGKNSSIHSVAVSPRENTMWAHKHVHIEWNILYLM